MPEIIRAVPADATLLSEMAAQSFIESHGHSAPAKDIDQYVKEKYSKTVLEAELTDAQNHYHIVYVNKQAAGYSKIVLNAPYESSPASNIAKLERIYLLKSFYGTGAGTALFDFNIRLIKAAQQEAVWLFVWTGNERAIRFYKKKGFEIIGRHDFPISSTHTNPNHQMLLRF